MQDDAASSASISVIMQPEIVTLLYAVFTLVAVVCLAVIVVSALFAFIIAHHYYCYHWDCRQPRKIATASVVNRSTQTTPPVDSFSPPPNGQSPRSTSSELNHTPRTGEIQQQSHRPLKFGEIGRQPPQSLTQEHVMKQQYNHDAATKCSSLFCHRCCGVSPKGLFSNATTTPLSTESASPWPIARNPRTSSDLIHTTPKTGEIQQGHGPLKFGEIGRQPPQSVSQVIKDFSRGRAVPPLGLFGNATTTPTSTESASPRRPPQSVSQMFNRGRAVPPLGLFGNATTTPSSTESASPRPIAQSPSTLSTELVRQTKTGKTRPSPRTATSKIGKIRRRRPRGVTQKDVAEEEYSSSEDSSLEH